MTDTRSGFVRESERLAAESQGQQQAEGPRFLATVESHLAVTQDRLCKLLQQLQEHGFYGVPSSSPTGAKAPDTPDSVRHHINDRLGSIESLLDDLEHQIAQL